MKHLFTVTFVSCMLLNMIYAADGDYKLIHIRNMTYDTGFSLAVPKDITIGDLKKLIEEREEVPVNQQQLKTRQLATDGCWPKHTQIDLQDDQTFSSYNFRRYQIVQLYGDATKKLHVMDMLRDKGFFVKFLDDMTINQVKLLIQKHRNIPIDVQKLQKRERVPGGFFTQFRFITLEDDKPCSFYNFGRYDLVQLIRVNASVKDTLK